MAHSHSLEQLYTELGHELGTAVMGSEPEDDEEALRRGKDWFEANNRALQLAVCRDEVLERLRKLEENEAQLVTVIIDAILASALIVPVVTVSRIIVCIGVDRLCSPAS